MYSEAITLQFIASFLPNVLLYKEITAASREARLNAQEALDFILADKESDEEGIINEEEEFESSSESELFGKVCYCLLFERYSQGKSLSMWKL